MNDFFDDDEDHVGDHDAGGHDVSADPSIGRSSSSSPLSSSTATAGGPAANTSYRPEMAYERELPEPAEWSAAAVRLLQGVVYHDDNQQVWGYALEVGGRR